MTAHTYQGVVRFIFPPHLPDPSGRGELPSSSSSSSHPPRQHAHSSEEAGYLKLGLLAGDGGEDDPRPPAAALPLRLWQAPQAGVVDQGGGAVDGARGEDHVAEGGSVTWWRINGQVSATATGCR